MTKQRLKEKRSKIAVVSPRPNVKPPKQRPGQKLVWDSASMGTYVRKRHGELPG